MATRRFEADYISPRTYTLTEQWLEYNYDQGPFFLWVDSFDPHEPWDAPPEYVKTYDRTPGYDGRIDPRAFHFRNAPALSHAARERVKALYRAKTGGRNQIRCHNPAGPEEAGRSQGTAKSSMDERQAVAVGVSAEN